MSLSHDQIRRLARLARLAIRDEEAEAVRTRLNRVLALVEDEARAHALKRLYLEVAHGNPALALYRRAGFVDHRRYLMSKSL